MMKKPTVKEVEEYQEKGLELENYKAQERIVYQIFEQYYSNKIFDNVLLKCIILNVTYNTNIYDTYRLAKHIYSLNLDDEWNDEPSETINMIDDYRNSKGAKKVYTPLLPSLPPITQKSILSMIPLFTK